MKLFLESGRDRLELSFPDEKIIDTLAGADIPVMNMEVVKDQIRQGIEQGLPDGIHGKKIAVIVPDDTRLWARGDLFVPEIVDALMRGGAEPGNICIIIALGTHRDMTPEQFPLLVGKKIPDKVTIFNSANQDMSRLIHMGQTSRGTDLYFTREAAEADHIIIFGGILHHLIAGFGGGRKYILPGIAGHETIRQNHALAFLPDGTAHPGVCQAELDKNPIHLDMEEAAEIFLTGKTCTYAALAANGEGQIFYTRTGTLKETFLHGCNQLDQACTAPIRQKGNFALISAGGYRTDAQLYQATKALFNAVSAVKEGGKILFVAQAAEGAGNADFAEALKCYKDAPEKLGDLLAAEFSMPGYVAFRVLDLQKRFTITLVSDFSEEETRQLGFQYAENIETYINQLDGKGYFIPWAENILPVMTPE